MENIRWIFMEKVLKVFVRILFPIHWCNTIRYSIYWGKLIDGTMHYIHLEHFCFWGYAMHYGCMV